MAEHFKLFFILFICSYTTSLAQELRISSYYKIGASTEGFSNLSTGDRLGSGLATIGDIDDNGVSDLAVGASLDDDGGNNRGSVYILFLDNNSSIINVQKISSTAGGFTGVLVNDDHFGSAVSPLGDLDNDGIEDIAVGALYDGDGAHQSGAIWILFLNNDGTVKSHQKISNTEGNFTGNLVSLASFGCSVATLGDLNKDGTSDIIVGAYRDNTALQSKSGSAWIIFLNNNGTVQSHKKIGAGNNGFNESLDYEDYFGGEISIVNDYDQNGIPDIAISAHRDDDGGVSRGAVYILSLDANGLVIKSSKISNSTVNFEGQLENNDYFGTAICSIGDIDNDGNHDLLIGSQRSAGGGTRKGAFYILLMDQAGSVNSLIKYKDDACNELDLNDNDMLGSNAAFIKNDNNHLEVLIAAPNGDDLVTDAGVIYHLTLSSGLAINAGPDIRTCSQKSVFLNAEAPGSRIGEWIFHIGSGNILAPNDPKSEVTDISSGVNQLIWRIQGSECPLDMDTVAVEIEANDQFEVNAGEDFLLCEESEVQLSATGVPGKWSLIEGQGIFENDEDPLSKLTHVSAGKTVLVWSVNYNNCETVRDTLNLFVEKKQPDLLKTQNDLILECFNQEVALTGSLNDPTGTTYWTVIEGSAEIVDPYKLDTKLINVSDNASVALELRGEICPIIDADTINISVAKITDPFIPNVFTPNEDQYNPTFVIDERLGNSSLNIYNRWGKLIFSDPSYKNDWSAARVASGAYYYVINSRCHSAPYKGLLTIIK